MRVLQWADEHPASTAVLLAVICFLGLHTWAAIHDGPLLLARADPQTRLTLYGQLAGTAVALLGVSLTVLAILVALPERPAIADVRESPAWPRIRGLLLTVALLALVVLVAAHLGSATDNSDTGCEWLEQLVLAASFATVVALLVAGIAFWLVLRTADENDDPSRGRGDG